MKMTDFAEVNDSLDSFNKIVELWTVLLEWENDSSNWVKLPVLDLNAGEISTKVAATKKRIVKILDLFKECPEINNLCMTCVNAINQFDINYMDIMLVLRDESFKERHWKELLEHMYEGSDFPKLESLNFNQLIQKNIKNHKSKINQLAEKARNEYIVEFKIEEIQKNMGNSQVVLKTLSFCNQLVIANPQTLTFAFQDNKRRCEEMLRSSEHLETFLRRIYDVHRNITKLERYFNYILLIQDILVQAKVIDLLPSVDSELKPKDRTLLRTLLSKYQNIFDDMKTRSLNMILRQIEDEEETNVDSTSEVTVLTDEMYQELSNPLHYPNHEHSHMFLTQVYAKIKSAIVAAFNLTPRFLNLSIEQFCYHVFSCQFLKRLSGLELFFPELKEMMYSDSGVPAVVGVVFANTETLIFERPVLIPYTEEEDVLGMYPSKVEAIEKEIKHSIKVHICRTLNFYLQNTYNFEKFITFIFDTKILKQAFDTGLKAIFVHDVSLMLDNPLAAITKDVVKSRLSKYLQLIINPLRKINAIHFRENLSQGDGQRLRSLESFILVLVYHAEMLKEIINSNETKFSSFFWQSKLKVSLKVTKEKAAEDLSRQEALESLMKTVAFTLNNLDKFSNLFMISQGIRAFRVDKLTITINAFDEAIPYGYQPVTTPGRLIFSGFSERSCVNLLLELSRSNFAGIRGHEDSGRRSTVQHLADITGRHCNSLNMSLLTSPAQLTTACLKSIGCQYWTMVENIENASADVLLELSKVIIALRKTYVSNGRRYVTVDKLDYLVSSDFAMVMIQSPHYTVPEISSKIPETILSEFRCSCFLSVDMNAFIYGQLSELIFFDEYDHKTISNLSRQLSLIFQLIHTGLNDKTFITAQLHNQGPPLLEEMIVDSQYWKATLRTIKPILSKLRTTLRTEHKTTPIGKIVFKAIYNSLKYELNVYQKDSLMLNYLAVFEPTGYLFRAVDSQIQDTALALHSFISINKIPPFSNLGLVEKVQALAETLLEKERLAVVNFGSNLQICSQDFNKAQQYIYSLKSGASSCTGNPKMTSILSESIIS